MFAQMTGAPTAGYRREPGMAASVVPRPLREIGFDQRLDEHVPLDVEFKDEEGHAVRLADYFGQSRSSSRSVLRLPDALHDDPQLDHEHARRPLAGSRQGFRARDGRLRSARETGAGGPEEGRISPAHDRPAGADGWHFLTGEPPSIERLTRAAGFRYTWDEESQQFAHPAGIVVLTLMDAWRALFGLGAGRETSDWRWSKPRRAGSAPPSTPRCSTAITTIR